MTIGTAPLRNREMIEGEAAADAATVDMLRRDLIAVQTERIAELENELAALRAVAAANEALLDQIKQLASDNHALEGENTALRAVADVTRRYFVGEAHPDEVLAAVEAAQAAGYLQGTAVNKNEHEAIMYCRQLVALLDERATKNLPIPDGIGDIWHGAADMLAEIGDIDQHTIPDLLDEEF